MLVTRPCESRTYTRDYHVSQGRFGPWPRFMPRKTAAPTLCPQASPGLHGAYAMPRFTPRFKKVWSVCRMVSQEGFKTMTELFSSLDHHLPGMHGSSIHPSIDTKTSKNNFQSIDTQHTCERRRKNPQLGLPNRAVCDQQYSTLSTRGSPSYVGGKIRPIF